MKVAIVECRRPVTWREHTIDFAGQHRLPLKVITMERYPAVDDGTGQILVDISGFLKKFSFLTSCKKYQIMLSFVVK